MPKLRSTKSTVGRSAASARALWRATGVRNEDFGKPIIAIANSFTEFVPGHVHLREVGQLVADEVRKAGGIPREFNTIAVDDGIAMGHDGMLYSLPSREIIADSVEYMVNAHTADAMVCISNCDKITPGMLMAALRLDIPTVMVSGGPMEAGFNPNNEAEIFDLVDNLVASGNPDVSDEQLEMMEQHACPTCGSCAGMFTANSMNCLAEALGLALPGNGSVLATHVERRGLFTTAAAKIMELTRRYYKQDDESALPRRIASLAAFENAMAMDIAMGGSTNTVLHLLAAAREGDVEFQMADIDRISRKVPNLCKVSPNVPHYHMEDVHRAGGVMGILGELDRAGLLDTTVGHVAGNDLAQVLGEWDVVRANSEEVQRFYSAAPGRKVNLKPYSQEARYKTLDTDREGGCIRSAQHAYSVDGGLAVLFGNLAQDGCIIKAAGVDASVLKFTGSARIFESQDAAAEGISGGEIKAGDVVVIRYEGPRGGPGMQEMLVPTSLIKAVGLATSCALITDGRFSGASSGLSIGHISPEAAEGGNIGLLEDGDKIEIDVPERRINVLLSEEELATRRQAMAARGPEAWRAVGRERHVSRALRAYAALTTSAAQGAWRDPSIVERGRQIAAE